MERKINFSVLKLVLILLLVAPQISLTAQVYPEKWLDAAIENNPGLLAGQKSWEAALLQGEISPVLPDPVLTAGFYLKPMDRLMGRQILDLGAMQMFPWFGTLKAQRNFYDKIAESSYQQFRDERNRLFFEMSRVWLQIYKTEKEIEIIDRYAIILKSREDLIYNRYSAGDRNRGLALDIYRLEIQLAELENRQAKLNEDRESLTAVFNILIGRDESLPLETPEFLPDPAKIIENLSNSNYSSSLASKGSLATTTTANPATSGAIATNATNATIANSATTATTATSANPAASTTSTTSATTATTATTANPAASATYSTTALNDYFGSNPGVIAADLMREASEIEQRLMRLKTFPMFGVGLQYSYFAPGSADMGQMDGGHMVMPMVSVSLPLFRSKNRSMIEQSLLMTEIKEYRYEQQIIDLQAQTVRLYSSLANYSRDKQFYLKQLETTRKAWDLILNAYAGGDEGFDELLGLLDQLLDLEWRILETDINQHNKLAEIDMILGRNIFK